MSRIASTLRNLFRRKRAERDLDDEIRGYASMLEDENRAQGMSPTASQREARIELGGVEQVKEEVRASRAGAWLDSLWQDLKFSARILRKSPRFTAIAVATLAIGIGANTAIFSVVNAVLLRPLQYPSPDRIVAIHGSTPVDFVPQPALHWVWKDSSSHLQFLERFAAYGTGDINFAIAGVDPQRIPAAEVSPNFFESFAIGPMAGRTFSAEEEAPGHPLVAVLGYSAALDLGDPHDVVGKKILLNGKQAIVIGVMPPGFEFPEKTRVWLPFAWSLQEEMLLKQALFFNSVGRLKPGVSANQAQVELAAIADREAVASSKVPGRRYPNQRIPIIVKPLHDELVGSSRSALLILLGAVAFVLLIACADVANLLLARASHRQREIAMRSALGAGRMRLVRQGLTESLMLAFLGSVSGLFLASWTLRGIQRLIPPRMLFVRGIHLDASVFWFLLAACLISSVSFGLFPVLHGLRIDIAESLKEGAASSPSRLSFLGRARGALAVAEIAMAMVLLAGAGLLTKSLWRLSSIDPGFRADSVMAAQISLPASLYESKSQRNAFFDATLGRITALPGVRDAAYVSDLPFGNIAGIMFKTDLEHETAAHQSAKENQFANFFIVTSDYFQTLGIPLVAGREFASADNAAAPPVVIINRTLASLYWPGADPVGQRISLPGAPKQWAEIVGIVGNTKHRELDEEISPAYYVPLAQSPAISVFLVARISGDTGTAVRAIRSTVSSVDNTLPFSEFLSMNDRLAASVAEPRFRTILLGSFAGIALLLAAAGIYGVMSYGVAQRTREIGIRVAVGAQRGNILRLVLGQTLRLTALGLLIGLFAAWGLTKVLVSVLYDVAPHDPATLLGVSILLGSVALLASYMPARRAMKVDPIVALRHE
jgi:putative ABC transport system permease protein